MKQPKRILVIDVGGTNVKILATGAKKRIKIPSGPQMTAKKMVSAVKKAAADWDLSLIHI